MMDVQTNKSGKSGLGTRRSRKDRSGYRAVGSRNAVTPHILSSLQGQNSLKADMNPCVRQMPGSDVISLELNIKGMTEPNRVLPCEDQTQASSTQPAETYAITNAAQRSPISRNKTGTYQMPGKNTQCVEFRGALNAYV